MSVRRIARPGIPGVVLIDDGPAYGRVKAGGPRGSALRDAIPPALTSPGHGAKPQPRKAEK